MTQPLPPLGNSTPLAPPLYQSSVFTLPDLDALDRIMNSEEPGYIYARDSHPNAKHLATELARLEAASWALICGSGMASISVAFLALLQQGDRVIASNRLYGRTSQLLTQELARYGVQTTLVDACDLSQVEKALQTPAKLLFVETMSNPMLRIVDIEALAKLAHQNDAILFVDNTFATPALVQPLGLGADLVMESLTKVIGGHSDVTLGMVCGDNDLLPQFTQTMSIWGLAANPFDCWLALRSLTSLSLRMKTASANAAALADWLPEQPGITQVIYPGRTDHPEFILAQRLFAGAVGNMLCFELDGGRDAVNRFMRGSPGIPFSPSLGHTMTTCSHPGTTSHRYVSPAEKRRQGITDGLVRLSVGLEDVDTIKAEIGRGLN